MLLMRIIERLVNIKQWRVGLPQEATVALPPPVAAPQIIANDRPGPRFDVAEANLPAFVQHCPTTMETYHWLRHINWSAFPERRYDRDYPYEPISHATFAAACLVKIEEDFKYMSKLRKHLVRHPALIWLLGFRLVADDTSYWGFDADASLPTARHFTNMLRKVPNHCFQFLLDESVRLLQETLAGVVTDFGQVVSLDTKHILAWVQENNPKAYVEARYNKASQPKGDADCKLGCKRRHNQRVDADNTASQSDSASTPTKEAQPARHIDVGEYYWGYASGVVATKVPNWGEFVLAEWTQTLDRPDVSYFFPLLEQTEARLGFRPAYGAFDAAFDAYYVYEHFHQPDTDWRQGFAAVPMTHRNKVNRVFDDDGVPLCEANLSMTLQYTFTCRTTLYEHERAHYVCPLKPACDTCPIQHKKASNGGCTLRLPTSPGARLRHQIDRESTCYKGIYKQRSATERINAQAMELGIERPKLRNRQAITNLNTGIYVVINLRGWQRVRERLAQQVTQTAAHSQI